MGRVDVQDGSESIGPRFGCPVRDRSEEIRRVCVPASIVFRQGTAVGQASLQVVLKAQEVELGDRPFDIGNEMRRSRNVALERLLHRTSPTESRGEYSGGAPIVTGVAVPERYTTAWARNGRNTYAYDRPIATRTLRDSVSPEGPFPQRCMVVRRKCWIHCQRPRILPGRYRGSKTCALAQFRAEKASCLWRSINRGENLEESSRRRPTGETREERPLSIACSLDHSMLRVDLSKLPLPRTGGYCHQSGAHTRRAPQ